MTTSHLSAPDTPRSPLAIAEDVRHLLRTQSPRRYGRVYLRVANDAVAVTGSVPTQEAKTYVLWTASRALGSLRIIDALEVQNRRSFRMSSSCA